MDYDSRNGYSDNGGGRALGGETFSQESRGRESYYGGQQGGGGGGGRQDQQYQQQPSRGYSPASQRASSPYAQHQGPPQPQYQNSASGTNSASDHQRPRSVAGGPGGGQQVGGGAYLNERGQQQQYSPANSAGGHSGRGSGAPFTQQRNSGTPPPSFNRTQSSDPQNGYRQPEEQTRGGWSGPATSEPAPGPASQSTPPPFAQRQNVSQSPSRGPQSLRASANGQTNRNGTPNGAPSGFATIGPNNEPLHDLERAVGLLKSTKFYAEGFVMKRTEVGADGKMVSTDSLIGSQC